MTLPFAIAPHLERQAVEAARSCDADALGLLAVQVARDIGFGTAEDYAALLGHHAEWVILGRHLYRVGPGAAQELAALPLTFPTPEEWPEWRSCIVDLRGCGFTLPCLGIHANTVDNVPIEGVYLWWGRVQEQDGADRWRLAVHPVLAPNPDGSQTSAGHGYLTSPEDLVEVAKEPQGIAFLVAVHAFLAASRVDLVELVTKPGERKAYARGGPHVQRLHLRPGALETWRRVFARASIPAPGMAPGGTEGRSVGLHHVREHEAVFWVREPRPDETPLATRGKLQAVLRSRRAHLSGTRGAVAKVEQIG